MKTKAIILKKIFSIAAVLVALASGLIVWKTSIDLRPIPTSLTLDASGIRKVQIVDRNHYPLTVTYQNRWNIHDHVSLHEIPFFLRQAFIVSEDKRFFDHRGVDWIARVHALWQNLKAPEPRRGASTISEQVIRMWHPRPRTLWSRWLEGFEASQLENTFSKAEILEFYLNQIPYAAQRRGLVQAANYYFDRDLVSLSPKEMLALVVLVRAPGRMDLRKGEKQIAGPMHKLAARLIKQGIISPGRYAQIKTEPLALKQAQLTVQASHFVQELYRTLPPRFWSHRNQLRTTLDAEIQTKVQAILNQRLKDTQLRQVQQGAALVVDHQTHEVLAWVNGGEVRDGIPGGWIDAVVSPRQPGSTLKPFLYALALQKGWTAATLVDDLPLTKPVGSGLHTFRNYSRTHYGPLVLRDALGNSLNIPAIRTIQFVGVEDFLNSLMNMGIQSLRQHPQHYGDGLALGNGEITLFELVQAYCVLAGRGVYHPLKLTTDSAPAQNVSRKIFSPEVASIIGDILSDPQARRLEFGADSLLDLPVQTAVKTGTSNDYRDAWAIGYNYRYTVGVWMGNLDHNAMNGVTGSSGPALVLRAIFTELNRHQHTRPLYLSRRLIKVEVCRDSGRFAADRCSAYNEWFVPGTEPVNFDGPDESKGIFHLLRPTNGLHLAMDPRIPDNYEAFSFELASKPPGATVQWYVDGELTATTSSSNYLWPLQRREHRVQAVVSATDQNQPNRTPWIYFEVK
jgi:penicillin-binding protein 1C